MQKLSDESNESLDTLTTFFDDGRVFDTMLQWVRLTRGFCPTTSKDKRDLIP